MALRSTEFDAGQLAPDELRIGQAFGADRRVDALDPQGAEGALLDLAVAVSVLTSLSTAWRATRIVFLRRPR
jgi:hypothetical protein